MLETVQLLGVTITAETIEKVSEYVLGEIRKGAKKLFITTPNPEILVYANSHSDYLSKLNSSGVALPDGAGFIVAALLLGQTLRSRITGVDFMERLCKDSKEKPISMGFLGGRGGVAERAAHRLKKKYPWIKVNFIGEDWPGSNRATRSLESTPSRVIPPACDILFVAFGFPKQEEWIYANLPHIPVKAAMGVGGAFDYLSGDVVRAPKFVRNLGLEWLFRLFRQPWRIRRQLALIKFILLLVKEKLR